MDEIMIALYVVLGAVVGMIYGLRRIFILEKRILLLDAKISRLLGEKTHIKKKKRR
ncbi:MAG: hypothetical protein PHE43_01755 [Candidatus Nanoarchaeia archaeon]|nr:hypothetical protein [Candidatus Nanoarchaeia archaeon]